MFLNVKSFRANHWLSLLDFSPFNLRVQVASKCEQQKNEFVVGAGNPGKNIRSYMESVRNHGVILDPTVMVALMSMMVLEGWQVRYHAALSSRIAADLIFSSVAESS